MTEQYKGKNSVRRQVAAFEEIWVKIKYPVSCAASERHAISVNKTAWGSAKAHPIFRLSLTLSLPETAMTLS